MPSISALTITDTTLHTNISNYTIFVDSVTLDQVIVTNLTIELYNVTSLGSNFTNTGISNAMIGFYGLDVGLIVYNVNTSRDLFISRLGNQNYNATFTMGQVIRITNIPTYTCSSGVRNILNATIIFFALSILLIPISILFIKGKLSWNTSPTILITIFVGITLGLVFIPEIANSITSFCG